MENTLSVSLMIAFLLIGAVSGAILAPGNTITEYVNVPGEAETVYQNISVDKFIEVPAISQLDLAKAEFLKAVENEEDEAGNTIDVLGRYDFDEMEVNKVYDDHNISYEDDKTTIDFKIRLRFDEDDARSKKKTFDVTVIFNEDEDTEVIVA